MRWSKHNSMVCKIQITKIVLAKLKDQVYFKTFLENYEKVTKNLKKIEIEWSRGQNSIRILDFEMD